MELPIAQLCAITLNLNRDPKKNRKPYRTEDFCFFVDMESNRPEAKAAAAYMRLVEDKTLPAWAVFCFVDFKWAQPDKDEASEVAMISDHAILLAPSEIDNGFEGLLLAEHCVSDTEVQMVYRNQTWQMKLPKFDSFTIAKSGVELDIVRPPG